MIELTCGEVLRDEILRKEKRNFVRKSTWSQFNHSLKRLELKSNE